MTIRKGRPARGGLRDPQAKDQFQSKRTAIERPETIDQAERWDVQKSRALSFGLCEVCAAQYAWGLQTGFTRSHPPCAKCSIIIGAAIGGARPNGWRNMRLETVRPTDTRECPHAHRSRNTTPEKYIEGYGTCRCGAFWTGFTTCHCSGCHHTFTNERAFAAHRIRGRCQDPEARGLVKITRAHWVGWGWPAQRDRLERIRG
jgi:hypothetical protein